MSTEKSLTIKVPDFDFWKILALLTLVLVAVNLVFTLQLKNSIKSGTGEVTGQPTVPNNVGNQQPQKVQVDIKNEPAMGNKNAKVVMVEFTDFQCPFCKRAFDTTYPQIKKDYIDTDKVYYVVRDFPLPFHTEADEAAEAANCAFDQNKYWEMHDLLFSKQNDWAGSSDPKTIFKGYAKDLGLNTATFNSCLDSGKYKTEIQADIQDGSKYGVGGTPTFYIGTLSDGFIEIVGAQPLSVFTQALGQALAG